MIELFTFKRYKLRLKLNYLPVQNFIRISVTEIVSIVKSVAFSVILWFIIKRLSLWRKEFHDRKL